MATTTCKYPLSAKSRPSTRTEVSLRFGRRTRPRPSFGRSCGAWSRGPSLGIAPPYQGLREFLTLNPCLWQRPGDVGLQAQASWIALIAGRNLHMKECTARRVSELKQQLAGDSPPSPVEALLIERVISAWLRIGYTEAREGQRVETSLRWARFELERQAVADRQLRAAIDALESYRKAYRPIAVELRQAEAVPPTNPILPTAHGEEPSSHNGHVNRINGMSRAATDKPGNGFHRVNGNGAAHILAGVGAGAEEP